MNPNYYAIIPASVRYDKNLTANAKLLYGEISALCNKEGFCWATNDYFADLYDKDAATVSRWISRLKKYNHIHVKINQKSNQPRKISLHPQVNTSMQKSQELLTKTSRAIDENVNPSLYSINNTINIPESAICFLIKNYPSRFETDFLMEYEKQFKSQLQFDDFCRDFNDAVIEKDKKYSASLFGMLRRYVRNWLRFKNKQIKNGDSVKESALSKLELK